MKDVTPFPAGWVLVGLDFICVIAAAYYSRSFNRSDDAEELIHTVERLIEIASQYREHAGKRIDDKFEFDLRLNEADAVMRTYDDVFRRSRKSAHP